MSEKKDTTKDDVIVNAKAEAENIIKNAEERAKAIIEKAKEEEKTFKSIPDFRKEMILRVSTGAGAFREQTGKAIAIKILAVADSTIKLLKEGF